MRSVNQAEVEGQGPCSQRKQHVLRQVASQQSSAGSSGMWLCSQTSNIYILAPSYLKLDVLVCFFLFLKFWLVFKFYCLLFFKNFIKFIGVTLGFQVYNSVTHHLYIALCIKGVKDIV